MRGFVSVAQNAQLETTTELHYNYCLFKICIPRLTPIIRDRTSNIRLVNEIISSLKVI